MPHFDLIFVQLDNPPPCGSREIPDELGIAIVLRCSEGHVLRLLRAEMTVVMDESPS